MCLYETKFKNDLSEESLNFITSCYQDRFVFIIKTRHGKRVVFVILVLFNMPCRVNPLSE